jgi:hypothetical protein
VPTAEDWQRLHDSFLAEYPVCPDCGAAWDLTLAEEEMGQLGDGTFEISLAISCPIYGADEVAGREPTPHRRASDGILTHRAVEFELATKIEGSGSLPLDERSEPFFAQIGSRRRPM